MVASRDGGEIVYACLYNVDPGQISVNYRRAMAPKLVNAVGARFCQERKKAGTAKARLAAIARLVRALHVPHLFTNANGRLNITLLLTKLLLDQGRPPVILSNQDDLFSGSYTVDEIVNELEKETAAFTGIVQEELARQHRYGEILPIKVSVPKDKALVVKTSSDTCSVM